MVPKPLTKEELKERLKMRCERFIKECDTNAPNIIIKNELRLIKEVCEDLLIKYGEEEDAIINKI